MDSLHHVSCLLDCEYEIESTDEQVLVEDLERHMWTEHRLPVDPLDIRGMIRPSHRLSRRESNTPRTSKPAEFSLSTQS